MAYRIVQVRRMTDTERMTLTPADGEAVWTTDTKLLFIGDGSTAGGLLVPKAFVGASAPTESPIPIGRIWLDTDEPSYGAQRVVTTVTGDTTLDSTHEVVLVNASAPATITLPAVASLPGKAYAVKRIGTADVTVEAAGGELIEGDASVLLTPDDAIGIVNDSSSGWFIV